jgi:hypothetical protein
MGHASGLAGPRPINNRKKDDERYARETECEG